MKLSFGWCAVAASVMALGASGAQGQSVDDGRYTLSDPFVSVEPEQGVRFQADALIWSRNNSGNAGPIISGPDTFSLNPLSNGYVGGYRVGGSWLIDQNYEFEGVWTWFSDWTSNASGVLGHAIAFNGGTSSTLVDPSGTANAVNAGTYFRSIHDAAMDPLANPTIQNYAFLKKGATATLFSDSQLYDVQANFKTRISAEQPFSFGVGYRNIRLVEETGADISGQFGTNDIPGGGNTHNILTDSALTAHGVSHLGGAADGFTNTLGSPTQLSLLWNGATANQLNGVQGTCDAWLLQRGIFTLEGVFRAGVFYNRMSGTVRETYAASGGDNSVYGRILSDQRDVVSFASNIGVNGLFQIYRNCRFRAGYEVMFLTNAAQSGNQQSGVSLNSLGVASYSVQGGSTVILHGARFGLEVLW